MANRPVGFVSLAFLSETVYTCTAPFSIIWGGFTWLGIGDLGGIGTISETDSPTALGTTVTLNAIDPTLLTESLDDIGVLQPANIYLGFLSPSGTLVDTPIKIWGGVVDAPSYSLGPDVASITLNLENRLINLNRGTQRRYTAEDQNRYFPDDTAFGWDPQLNDLALVWG